MKDKQIDLNDLFQRLRNLEDRALNCDSMNGEKDAMVIRDAITVIFPPSDASVKKAMEKLR